VIVPGRSIPEALKILDAGNVLINNRAETIGALNVEEFEKKRLAEASNYEFLKLACHYFRERLSALNDPSRRSKRNGISA
jgi:hypothetical protein